MKMSEQVQCEKGCPVFQNGVSDFYIDCISSMKGYNIKGGGKKWLR